MLSSIPAAAGRLRTRCLLVDNASEDDTVAIARTHPAVTVIEAGVNLGYSGAINVGREHAGQCAALLIVNPDLVLEPSAIERLFEAIAQPGVGIAVPKLLNSDGSLYLTMRREPSVVRALGDAMFGARLAGRPGWLSETVRDTQTYERAQDVDWSSGAVMLISWECDRAVGRWDEERFFLYSEETDYAARARSSGYRVRYVPSAGVLHEEGGSGRSPSLAALLAVNRLRYYEKYHRPPSIWAFRLAVALQHLLRSFRPSERVALLTVLRRSEWGRLPGGIR
jgi:N-acetylglucosaminyl-diphospho-decaprenol L-rhamnosyltransferase